MQGNWINLVFVIDESSSMSPSRQDVTEGFKSVVEEQKKIKDGRVSVSLYTFASEVKTVYKAKDINEIDGIDYKPMGMTAMNDGIGFAIDDIGKWLYEKDQKGEEMPSKTLVVVMTDGYENSSKEYTIEQVKEKITHQTEKYSWEFVYIGMDIMSSKDADKLGIKLKAFTSKIGGFKKAYCMLNKAATNYRNASNAATGSTILYSSLAADTRGMTEEYNIANGTNLS